MIKAITGRILLIIALMSCFVLGIIQAPAFEPDDPMVKISALPIDKNKDEVLAGISKHVSEKTGLEQKFITYYWQTFDAINCNGKKMEGYPVLVDLYVPGFLTTKQIGEIMEAIAQGIEDHAGVEKKWVFIHTHFPKQGMVYISGEVQVWEDYQGSEKVK